MKHYSRTCDGCGKKVSEKQGSPRYGGAFLPYKQFHTQLWVTFSQPGDDQTHSADLCNECLANLLLLMVEPTTVKAGRFTREVQDW